MKILLTGSEGFVGVYLRKELEKSRHVIHCIDRVKVSRTNYFCFDLSNEISSLAKLLKDENFDLLIHLAAAKGDYNLNYDDFTDMKPIDKMNKLSIIMSKKNFSEGHEKRINFIDKLINSPIAKYIDIYGDGYTPIPDKWDGIAQYKYHLVIENSSIKDYWSEKLADSFLGFSLPIYYGCPNIFDYFSKDSIILIDIDNIEKSIRTIKNVIEENLYDDHVRSINIARNQVLNEYNIFNLMAQMSLVKGSNFKNVKLRTNYYFSDSWIKKIARYVINKMSL